MIKYNLTCLNCKNVFNSWFSTSLDFDRLIKRKLISCFKCDSKKINKSIMSPSVSIINKDKKNDFKSKEKIRKKVNEYQNFIKNNCDYVGSDFAYRARVIHYDKKKSKPIYGKASDEEIKDLNEEGIETGTIPWFDKQQN